MTDLSNDVRYGDGDFGEGIVGHSPIISYGLLRLRYLLSLQPEMDGGRSQGHAWRMPAATSLEPPFLGLAIGRF